MALRGQHINQGRNQRTIFNGHKRVHSLKFWSIVVPDGIIGNLNGPAVGKRYDFKMLGRL